MSLFTREELKTLVERGNGPCASIFMPAYVAGREVQQNPIRLKNLLRDAEEQLIEMGVRSTVAREIIAPASDLVDNAGFWQRQGEGLAAFLAEGFNRVYKLPIRLDEMAVVTSRFHLKPLMPLLTNDGKFYLLAISQKEVRLLDCTRFSVSQVDLSGTEVPTSIMEALWADDPEKQHQFRTMISTAGVPRSGVRGEAMYHGHGVVDQIKDDLRRYFQQIDRGLNDLLSERRAPLVLASVDYLQPIYQDVNTYPRLIEGGVSGNPDEARPEELKDEAWKVVERYFLSTRDEAIGKYRERLGTGLASGDLQEVVSGAYYGRVDSLFVATGVQVWGAFDPQRGKVSVHDDARPGDEDLLDFASVHTILNSGTVFAMRPDEMPDSGPLGAVFRY